MKQMPLTSKRINDLNKYLWIIILASTVLCIYTYFKSESLPQPKDIKQALYQQPKQDAIDLEPFVKKYHGKKYMIKPRFSYDLHGLVVSYKNLDEAWFNIYYDDDPYNIKDLCVVWGGAIWFVMTIPKWIIHQEVGPVITAGVAGRRNLMKVSSLIIISCLITKKYHIF